MLPSPWVAVMLWLAAYRLVRLIGWDDLPPIARTRAWITGERVYRNPTEATGDIFRFDRPLLEHFLTCAFCQGFWTSVAVYGAWVGVGSPGSAGSSSWLFYALVPFALSTAVGLTAKNLDP